MEISVEGVRASVAEPMLRDFFILMPFLYAVYVSILRRRRSRETKKKKKRERNH